MLRKYLFYTMFLFGPISLGAQELTNTQHEVTDLDGEVARPHHQGDRSHDQVAVIAEVDLVDHPDARARNGDQAQGF